jgi:heme-degrading monooxygenase HmoA
MVTVGMNYKVIPGKDEQFTAVCGKVIEAMAGMPGHVKTHLYRDVWSEHDYLIVSEWSDEQAFNDFISSDRFRRVADWGKENILAGRPSHQVYGGDQSS